MSGDLTVHEKARVSVLMGSPAMAEPATATGTAPIAVPPTTAATPAASMLNVPVASSLEIPEVVSDDLVKSRCIQNNGTNHTWDRAEVNVLRRANVMVVVGGNDCNDPNMHSIATTTKRSFIFEPSPEYEKCLAMLNKNSGNFYRVVEVRVKPGVPLKDHPPDYKGVAELLADQERYPNQQLSEGQHVVFVINAAGSDDYAKATMTLTPGVGNKMASFAEPPKFWSEGGRPLPKHDVAIIPIQDVLGPSTIVDIMHWDTW
eukprot:CAMPEP_0119470874 /NCGR_PEP_ID=MMETSP1344-20130328/3582_1 /TAXON_ID=236787 /ORGANISM="Florenciella parvula, Strain CCMP2471" /LENGTH=259 /DNA_ID=CAMNT_0007503597 /DNA_START=239 /DNA_END=1015 /DNA_ORIENTATION=+